jgi:hypothetical protein
MANGNQEEWLIKLQDSLTDLKITTSSVETKLDQLKESFDDMQDAVSLLTSTSNTQETRISLLELACSKIPPTILEDVAIMKSQLRFYQKFMMLITGSIVGIIFKLVFSDFF